MTQYHEGQEVEALCGSHSDYRSENHWVTAKIIRLDMGWSTVKHLVEFADGNSAVFDADHIRECGVVDWFEQSMKEALS
jgi:hypothetical protein